LRAQAGEQAFEHRAAVPNRYDDRDAVRHITSLVPP
jgi:hypothetical protein